MQRFIIRFGAAVALLMLLSFFIWLTDSDLGLARLVYDDQIRWPGLGRFPWNFIYTYAAIPAFVLAGIALVVLLFGFVNKSLAAYRRQALFLVLLLVLGPGLVVNVIFKDNQGRARPRELIEFGGKYEFSQMWEKGATGRNSSFPSGHSSAGFYLMAPWFILRRYQRRKAFAWLGGGIAYGSLVGATRILQGGHFLSDVLWAGGMVFLTGEILALLLKADELPSPKPS